MEKEKIIAVTWNGFIIKPSFDCHTGKYSSEKEKIGKIAKKDELYKEYKFIENLPQIGDTPYIKKKDVSLCKIHDSAKDIINKEFNKLVDSYKEIDSDKYYKFSALGDQDKEGNLNIHDILEYQLIMPDLGKDFSEYLEKFKSNVIDIIEFLDIMNALFNLCEEIKKLNKMGIYHLDIKTNNLIYDEIKKKFILIDFNVSYNEKIYDTYENKTKKFFFDDKNKIVNIFIQLIGYGIKNSNLYNSYISVPIDIEKKNDYFNETNNLQKIFDESNLTNNLDLIYKCEFDMNTINNKFEILEIDNIENIFDIIFEYFLYLNKSIIENITTINKPTILGYNEFIIPFYTIPNLKIKKEFAKEFAKRFVSKRGGKYKKRTTKTRRIRKNRKSKKVRN